MRLVKISENQVLNLEHVVRAVYFGPFEAIGEKENVLQLWMGPIGSWSDKSSIKDGELAGVLSKEDGAPGGDNLIELRGWPASTIRDLLWNQAIDATEV